MLTENDVLRISEAVERIYAQTVSELLINISRHLSTEHAVDTATWEMHRLSEMGALTQESIRIIAENTRKTPTAIKQAVAEAAGIALEDVDKVLMQAAADGRIHGVMYSWQASEGVANALNALVNQAEKDLNLVNTVMLNSTQARYRSAIKFAADEERRLIEEIQSAANAIDLQIQLAKAQNVLNVETARVAVGNESRVTALRSAINKLADEGITGFVDIAGRQWSPEAYVNMDIRTTVHNAAIQAQKERSAEFNVHTFQVSSHAGARPLCAPYQGKILSWGNDSGTVYDLYGNAYPYESINLTSYGEPAGLFGINCGHFPQTFVSGYSMPRYSELTPEQDEINKQQYKLSQQQRALERNVRAAKTKAACFAAQGEDMKSAFDNAALKVKEAQEKYKDFCADNNRTERNDRLQVYGYNKSVSGKVTWSAKKQKEA